MKRFFITTLICAMSLGTVFAEYTLSKEDTEKVAKVVVYINKIVDKKGEAVRARLLVKIDQVLARPNLSERNTAIFSELRQGLNTTTEVEEKTETLDENDHKFIFEDAAHRCNTNPCNTTESFVKIRGSVSNALVKYVEVNSYRLKSYKGSDWEYNPNTAYGNFSDGENVYSISYLASNGDVLLTQEYIVNKLIAEEQAEPTDIPQAEPVIGIEKAPSEAELTVRNSATVSNGAIPYVDENEVREYWRGLINGERTLLGLKGYSYDSSLDKTAKIWSDMALRRGYIDHKVDSPGDTYYDYWKKAKWMEDNGVVCKNISRATFSESIAWNNYYCKDTSKCTSEIKKAVKRSFDFYMSEKGTNYDPHYRAIAHKLFETMGLGLSVKDQGNGKYKMYLTNHYCTYNTK